LDVAEGDVDLKENGGDERDLREEVSYYFQEVVVGGWDNSDTRPSLNTQHILNLSGLCPGMESNGQHPQCFWGEYLVVANICPPLPILIVPRPFNSNGRPSNNGNKTLNTSFPALSISSMTIHFPSLTAVVKIPARQVNEPGVLVTYVPNKIFASV
jgi:hypothetical protein